MFKSWVDEKAATRLLEELVKMLIDEQVIIPGEER
jgi:hypothetical protein